jgi:hypothetical protein
VLRRANVAWKNASSGLTELFNVEIVMKVWPATAMKRVARLPHTGPAVSPMACPPDICPAFIGEKHVGASIEALGVALQSP